MKHTKYWYISLTLLFSCQNDEVILIDNVQKTKNIEVNEIEKDTLSISKKSLNINTIKENDSINVEVKGIIKKTQPKQKKEIQVIEESCEPSEYKLPKEMYFKFIKSQKFYDDSVAYYNSFMKNEYWRKKYDYPDSVEYHKKYLLKWEARINYIKGQYDWNE